MKSNLFLLASSFVFGWASAAGAQSEGDTGTPPEASGTEGDATAPVGDPEEDLGTAPAPGDAAAVPPEQPVAEPLPVQPPPAAAEPATPPPAVDPVADAAPPLESAAPPESDPYAESADYEPLDDDPPYTGPFSQGSVGVSIVVGSAQFGERNYLILGGGLSYFILDGLSLGLDGDVWLGADPRVSTLTPHARYVFYFVPVIKPYIGAFYRHYFIGGAFDDLDSVGGRAGAYLVTGSGSYIGLGAIYEKFLSCDATAFRDCDGWYPEITLGISL